MTKLLKSAIDFANSKNICMTLDERIIYLADLISHMADRDERTDEIVAFKGLTDKEIMEG